MSKRLPQLGKPDPAGSFKEYITYYRSLRGWSEEDLAYAARIKQSELNKVANRIRQNVKVDFLTCVCIALQLNIKQSRDLIARVERAFSPSSKLHAAYIELIETYNKRPFNNDIDVSIAMLNEADKFLRAKGLPSLPDVYAY